MVDRRHEDKEAACERYGAGETRALGAERLFHDLDEYVRPSLSRASIAAPQRGRAPHPSALVRGHGLVRHRPAARPRALRRRPPRSPLAPRPPRPPSRRPPRDDRVRRPFAQRRRHTGSRRARGRCRQTPTASGKDFRHAPFVDVSDHASLPLALDEELGDEIVFQDRDARFVVVGGDDHLLGHAGQSLNSRSAASGRSG